MLRHFLLQGLFLLICVLPAQAAGPRETAGRVEFVTGDTQFIDASQHVRRPVPGDALHATDTIVTGGDGEVHLDMEDGGYLAVRPNTRLNVKDYRAHGDKDDRVLLNLLKGTFRSFTGWIPWVAPKGYATQTITATIGVRGTDHEPLFIPEGSGIGEAGTYDKVNEGATFIDHASGRVDVLPNTAGFAPLLPGGKVRLLDSVPEFFRPSPNENLLAGRHKMVQDRLQQRLDERQRLNKPHAQEEGRPSEMQETPTDGTPGLQDAPGSSLPPGISAVPATSVPATSATGVAVPASAAVAPRIPAASPSVLVPGIPAASAAAAASKIPAPVPAVVAPAAQATSAAPVVPAASEKSAPAAAPGPTEKSLTAVPKSTERPRSVSGRPRGVTEDKSAVEPPRTKVVPPVTTDREKTYNERRKKQQDDHHDLYERDRDLERQRDLDHDRDLDRAAAKRNKEQH